MGNDTLASAWPVGLSGLSMDLSVCLGDEDWFVVSALEHQRVLVTARWAQGDPGVMVEAYGSTGALLGRATGVDLAALSAPGNAAGQVFVRISSPAAESAYQLDISVQRLQDCQPDAAEFNNTPDSASPLPAQGVYTICGTDVDMFRVEGGLDWRLNARVDFSTVDGDVDLGLLLPDGSTLFAVSDGVTGTEVLDELLPADPPTGGAYFLVVYAATSGTTARYVLTTQLTAP